MRLLRTCAISGALALSLAAGAQALPATKALAPGVSGNSAVEPVHYRPYRHCHWRYGYRRCHGGYYGGYGYRPYYSYGYGYPYYGYSRPYYSYGYGYPYYGYSRPYYSYQYSPGVSFYVGPRYGHYGYRRSWW